jgi:hypothetical protein
MPALSPSRVDGHITLVGLLDRQLGSLRPRDLVDVVTPRRGSHGLARWRATTETRKLNPVAVAGNRLRRQTHSKSFGYRMVTGWAAFASERRREAIGTVLPADDRRAAGRGW